MPVYHTRRSPRRLLHQTAGLNCPAAACRPCAQMGIVGLPNVGKSTLFNTLTRLSIPAENFPFCTIDPNNARVVVPDPRFDWLVSDAAGLAWWCCCVCMS